MTVVKAVQSSARFLAGLLQGILGFCLGLMSVMVFLQVVLRRLFSTTWLALEDLVVYAFSISTFVGAALLFRESGHISITFFTERLSPRWQRIVQGITQAIVLVFVGFMLVYGVEFVAGGMGQFSPLLRVPVGLVYIAVPLFAVATLVFALESALTKPARKEGESSETR